MLTIGCLFSKRICRFSAMFLLLLIANPSWGTNSSGVSREVTIDPGAQLPVDGNLKDGEIALTFDDGPDPVITTKILNILKKYEVKAVFFQIGIFAQNHPEMAKEILAQGHSLGSHSWDHSDLAALPLNEAIANLVRGHEAVEKASGPHFHTPFFRFPKFSDSNELKKAVSNIGFTAFYANIITEDWMTPDPKVLLQKSLDALEANKKGIVLFHDIQPQTAEMLEAFLKEIFARGYKTVVFRSKETLASLGNKKKIWMGTFAMTNNGDPGFNAALHEFNLFTLPVFFRLVHPKINEFDFSIPDKIAEAAPPGTKFRIHNLIWCDNNPDWLKDGNFTGAQLKEILVKHIQSVVRHYQTKYPNKILSWDVVNEPFSWQGNSCPWNKIGLDAGLDQNEYIRLALRTVRSEAPKAKLFLNDFGGEGLSPRSDSMFNLVSEFKRQGIPIDGVGLESHFMVQAGGAFPRLPPKEEIIQNLNRLASLGVSTMITEADFSIRNSDLTKTSLMRQADDYRTLLHACLAVKSCRAFITWGVGDKDSWIPQFFPGWGAPLLFDEHYNPKQAYEALKSELSSK